jgi:acylphosphatase
VGFRHATQTEAQKLGLKGWVRNLDDGAVEAVAEGAVEVLETFVKWCSRGPPTAEVRSTRVSKEAATGEFEGFTVRR